MRTLGKGRRVFYAIFLSVVIVAVLFICDYFYYSLMIIKHKNLVDNDAEYWNQRNRGRYHFTLQDLRLIYGKPDTLTSDRIGYTAYDLTRCPTTFPFFEVLLTGSSNHFKRTDIEFTVDKDGVSGGASISFYDGLFKYKRTLEEERKIDEAMMRMKPPPPVETITVVVTKPTPIIVVSDLTPDPYTHPSTHPNSLRIDLDSSKGHGDGSAKVRFVGKALEVMPTGELRPVPNVTFFQMNDNMLLRESRHDLLPFQGDANGDFDGELHVFAARGYTSSTNENIIYQTGTAKLGAESKGFKIRQVNVRYEQPSTLIIMERE